MVWTIYLMLLAALQRGFAISRFVLVFERGLVWIWILEVLRHFFWHEKVVRGQ
jgi:hypothetical protein